MPLCDFRPYGRQCPNPATVTVTLTGMWLPLDEVPTCDKHVHDWIDEVASTARPITGESALTIPQPATEPATS